MPENEVRHSTKIEVTLIAVYEKHGYMKMSATRIGKNRNIELLAKKA